MKGIGRKQKMSKDYYFEITDFKNLKLSNFCTQIIFKPG